MKKLIRNPNKFDVLELFSSMATTNGYKINNLHSIDDFIKKISSSIKESSTNDIMKFGKRIESLFAYVIGALGQVKLLKQEDVGNIYSLDDDILAPDYKAILKDNTQFLIEVKNFYLKDFKKEFILKKDYYLKLQKYADINNIPLKFAIYFSTMNQWVLLPITAFKKNKKTFSIDFATACAKSEMSLLGDRMIGTTPNLEIHMLTNKHESKPITTSGIVDFTIREIKFFCNKNEIKNTIEKNITFDLIKYGKWEEDTEIIMEKDNFIGIKFIYAPTEISEQNFEIIGTLSGMISNKFKEMTINNGEVEALDLDLNPSLFKIFIPDDYDSKDLPLWQFILQANTEFKGLQNYEKKSFILEE